MLGDDEHVARLGMLQVGIENDGGERGENPRPRPDGVMRDIKPEHREQPIAFIFCAEDALRDVAAAAGFRAGIPECPPLHSDDSPET